MPSKTGISNLALAHLGIGKRITSLETEKSSEAAACRDFYDLVVEATLRDFPWSFANIEREALALVEEEPTDDWAYSYRYPSGCANLLKIHSDTRNDTKQSRVPYKIAKDSQGKLIYTDKEDAEVMYTELVTDTDLYPADFVLALSFRLAVYIAPQITGADLFKMGERSFQLYLMEIEKAKARNVNEQQDEEEPESEFIRGRE